MRIPSLLLALTILSLGLLPAQVAKNMSLVGQLSYGNNELSDVWGYVDSSGTEYALVGTYFGLSIVSLADPANPIEVDFIPGAGTIWRDMKTWSHYGYVSNEGGNGLLIVDLSTLPGQVAHKDTVIGGMNTIHNIWIDEQGYLYTAGSNTFSGGVAVLDLISDPWRPRLEDTYELTYVHDLYVRNRIGYTGEIYEGRLGIVDFDGVNGPEVMGSTTYIDGFTHNTWLNDAGDVCFTTDELSAAYIYAWDVSDPTDIRQLDRIRSPLSGGTTIPHNVHVKDDFLVISYYRDGVYVVDAARPHNLIEVGYYDTSPRQGSGFNGAWGAYPFLPSGLVLASDIEEGLFVLQPNYPRACYLEGVVRDSVSLVPLGQVEIMVSGGDMDTQTATDGSFAVGTVDSGTYTATFSRYGYVSKTLTVNLQNGQLTDLEVLLEPTPRVNLDLTVRDARSEDPLPQVTVIAEPQGVDLSFDYET
ncbi:MAG: choice-of-anchor B family protein, partial [Bacteroidetes bacterium]